MILFKRYHVYPLITGVKTYTRRFWKYPRRVGSIHKCQHDFTDFFFGTITITDVCVQPLGMMTEEDAYNEGGYTLAMYKKTLESITKKPWDPYAAPYVVKFRFTLADTIDPNGGTEMREEYKCMYDGHMREVS